MRAVVLVGGEGTRLRPLTSDTPKQMLPIAGIPMIEWVVGHLASHGIDDVVLSMGYRPDAFRAAYPDGRCAGARLTYAVEPELLDTAGAIKFAATEAGVATTFLVINGDVLTELDLAALIAFHRERDARATISLTPVDDPSRFGVVPTDPAGRVTAFIEKPPPDEAPTNLINAGTYVLEPDVLDLIPGGRRVSIERETFPQLVESRALYALASDAYWLDTGTPAAYVQANVDRISDAAIISPSASVAPGATIESSVVDRECCVEDGAVVVESVLLPGARVGRGAVVRRSVVGWDAEVGEGAKLDDHCVVGRGCEVSAGTALQGARVPEPA